MSVASPRNEICVSVTEAGSTREGGTNAHVVEGSGDSVSGLRAIAAGAVEGALVAPDLVTTKLAGAMKHPMAQRGAVRALRSGT